MRGGSLLAAEAAGAGAGNTCTVMVPRSLARISHQPQSVDGGLRTACRPAQRHGGLDIVDGHPGSVPIPSRAMAPSGKARLRQRDC